MIDRLELLTNRYNEINEELLKPEVLSDFNKQKKLSKEIEEDLIAENQRLRMENAYLKKLQALVQERTKPKQEKKW